MLPYDSIKCPRAPPSRADQSLRGTVASWCASPTASASRGQSSAKPPVVRILRDELLFGPGQRKTHLYLVEAGSVVLYQKRTGGIHGVIEFAFAGDIVGFGFLPEHIHCAQTLGATRVRCLPLNALGDLLANDARALRRYDAAVGREFEFRRNQVIGLYTGQPPTSSLPCRRSTNMKATISVLSRTL